ncbi:MAG: polysaccharide biosynthesis/export family protein [Planctomycetes bacterium]|nr:polysaccharide biosynthesis/export family protein [Planctomycetota bacterium]
MSGHRRLDTRSGIGASAVRLVALGGMVIGAVGGCEEHRISLAEFQEIQEKQVHKTPATQPATTPEQAKAMINEALGPYQVGPGDVLRVVMTGMDQQGQLPPLDVRLDRNGDAEMPGLGKVHLGDLALEAVEQAIRSAYVPKVYREAVVYVSLVDTETTDVLVVGSVALPGLVSLKRTDRNLLHAVVAAGGLSELASGEVVLQRLREPGQSAELQLTEPVGLQTALALAPLESGDIVTVRAATPNTIFVGGLVNAPRPQIFPSGVPVTLLQALASSGGLRTDVTPHEATLIRRMPDGQDVQVKLNLDRVATGKDPNITLAAGDILWVPESLETRIQDWVNKNVFLRVGGTATAGYGFDYSSTGANPFNTAARQGLAGGRQGGGLQDQFDPLGFLQRGAGIQRANQLLQSPP